MTLTAVMKKITDKKESIKSRIINQVIDALADLPAEDGVVRFTTTYLAGKVDMNTRNWTKKTSNINKAIKRLIRLGKIEVIIKQATIYQEDYSVLITPNEVRILDSTYLED